MVKVKSKKLKNIPERDLSSTNVDNLVETSKTHNNKNSELRVEKLSTQSKKIIKKIKKKKEKKPKDNDVKCDNITDDAKIHKKHLEKLQKIDPEFYSFLEQNDKKLLKFDFSDDEGENDKKSDDDDDDVKNELTHQPCDEFEVASDEEDFNDGTKMESDNEDIDHLKPKQITLKMLKEWQIQLSSDKVKIETIKVVIKAFNSALVSVATEKENSNNLRVEGASVFNGIIQLCVLNLQGAIGKYLGIPENSKKLPEKVKKWTKIRNSIKNYIVDVTKLLENLTSGNILTIILKHLHHLLPYLKPFGSNIVKPILRRLINIWSCGEETVRILSFLCILRITRNEQPQYLGIVLKSMYMSYVRNSKFVSPSTLPAINFMRRSLVEMFALDLNVAYQHSFLYIRQLAIHLRNAVTLKKKESFQTVYNWQFLNSLRLWGDLLSLTYNRQQLQPLIYPLVTIITGCIKLIPTAQYFPLRFHCIKILIKLSKETNIFIPVMPFILEVLSSSSFNKKSTQTLMKPIQFTCVFRVGKKELASNVFKDEVIENIYGLCLEYLSDQSNSIAFPDLALLCRTNIKSYLKICKHPNYNRKLKQLCDKIDDNTRFIENERKNITFTIKDYQLVQGWEATIKNKGTPLSIFYESWEKINAVKQKRVATDSEDINDYKLPTINRKMFDKKSKQDDDGPVVLFPSDDDDSDNEMEAPKPKKIKKAKKPKSKRSEEDNIDDEEEDDGTNNVDIIKDMNLDDWD